MILSKLADIQVRKNDRCIIRLIRLPIYFKYAQRTSLVCGKQADI